MQQPGNQIEQQYNNQIPAQPHLPLPSLDSSTQRDQHATYLPIPRLQKHFHLRRFRNCGICSLPWFSMFQFPSREN